MSSNRVDKLLEEDEFVTSKWFKFKKITRHLKLIYYLFQRPFCSCILSKIRPLRNIKQLYSLDRFLLNDGGMFKEHAYAICSRKHQIRGSTVLVPGCGYGQHLVTLAGFKPKKIVACDLYEYPAEWNFLHDDIKKNGTDIIFLKGEISHSMIDSLAPFDWIITDAVLEHINDLNSFLKKCHILLKDGGGFFASFGPIWYGPGGDHIDWGNEGIFNHLLLPENIYSAKLLSLNYGKDKDSTDGIFMVKNRLFSYLKAKEYLDILDNCGFIKEAFWIKFSSRAWKYFKKYPEKESILQKKGAALFDRYCSGIYIWAVKRVNKEL